MSTLKRRGASTTSKKAKSSPDKAKQGTRYVAFLRGINLGKRRPAMTELKALFEELGFTDVATFIASGNLVFSSDVKDRRKLETQIARHLEESLGYDVQTFVRRADEVLAVGKTHPFPEEGKPGITVYVCFLHEPLSPTDARALENIRTADDEFRVIGREYYWLCRIKSNESTVWALPELKKLKLPNATMRNMTSVRKLIAKRLSVNVTK